MLLGTVLDRDLALVVLGYKPLSQQERPMKELQNVTVNDPLAERKLGCHSVRSTRSAAGAAGQAERLAQKECKSARPTPTTGPGSLSPRPH